MALPPRLQTAPPPLLPLTSDAAALLQPWSGPGALLPPLQALPPPFPLHPLGLPQLLSLQVPPPTASPAEVQAWALTQAARLRAEASASLRAAVAALRAAGRATPAALELEARASQAHVAHWDGVYAGLWTAAGAAAAAAASSAPPPPAVASIPPPAPRLPSIQPALRLQSIQPALALQSVQPALGLQPTAREGNSLPPPSQGRLAGAKRGRAGEDGGGDASGTNSAAAGARKRAESAVVAAPAVPRSGGGAAAIPVGGLRVRLRLDDASGGEGAMEGLPTGLDDGEQQPGDVGAPMVTPDAVGAAARRARAAGGQHDRDVDDAGVPAAVAAWPHGLPVLRLLLSSDVRERLARGEVVSMKPPARRDPER